jgi:hypothetical protein
MRRVVSRHENSKAVRRCCTPLVVFQRSKLTGHLICCAFMPSCGRRVWRQVAGGGVVGSLACIAVAVEPSRACPCPQPVSIHSPCLPHRRRDQPSEHAPRPRLCSLSAKRPALHGTLVRSRLGAQAGPPPCHLALTLHTKPEVNLDCVPAAARGCALVSVPRRSPPPVSRHSYLQSLHFPRTRLWL